MFLWQIVNIFIILRVVSLMFDLFTDLLDLNMRNFFELVSDIPKYLVKFTLSRRIIIFKLTIHQERTVAKLDFF